MFWRKKTHREKPRLQTFVAPEPARKSSPADKLNDAAETLAQSLNAYSDAAWRASKDEPDEELKEARAKLTAARKIVTEGRLAYALGRCLPEHIRYWPSWIKRDDFRTWVGFDAQEITAHQHEEQDSSRTVKAVTIELQFREQNYRIVLRDEGSPYDPRDFVKCGQIELWHYDQMVAHLELIEHLEKEYSHWEYREVRALRVGPWMKDVLDMATQIDSSRQRKMDDFIDNRAREAGKNIDLGGLGGT